RRRRCLFAVWPKQPENGKRYSLSRGERARVRAAVAMAVGTDARRFLETLRSLLRMADCRNKKYAGASL
ncbi:hypothetical protein, partial [Rufibacter ruber]|uniref:hypothetical protein n=1 Tax=Rufibacter ruber TaxID=1783499 RepID=UPI0019D3B274